MVDIRYGQVGTTLSNRKSVGISYNEPCLSNLSVAYISNK